MSDKEFGGKARKHALMPSELSRRPDLRVGPASVTLRNIADTVPGSDDLSLPKEVAKASPSAATVQKIINEVLASPSLELATTSADGATQTMTFAKESRDLLIECCVEFITMLSSEANDIAEKDAKKTIACEHITKALQDLGFEDYIPELLRVAEQFRVSQVSREKKQSKIEQSGMTNDELIAAQEALFRDAGEKYNATT
ncbi:histone-fold-containing protein [Neohortaea acidophila]|uniref:NCT transcriptional regulatory complex subunit B n=1 Tax=Neohortaea acidophila TaxID=245834 RepID=A0A6A6Q5V7_9PEZI|nr:histone-fold-containing protein [Neohortaea acidophila]KAF2487672.1 histone-fold-containing protein [Neohortaea acidophila]